MSTRMHPVAWSLSALVSTSLIGCGGGSGGGNVIDTPGATPTVLSGVVVGSGPIKNALVCLDLNANGSCDSGEPSSARTGADGAYRITLDTRQVSADQIAQASLIAPQVPGAVGDAQTTIDMANPASGNTSRPYTLRLPPGKTGQINPLSTLLATAMAAGMGETTARDNLVLQLGLKSAALIDDYQADPASSEQSVEDNARTAAVLTASLLEQGATLNLADQRLATAAGPGALRSLSYTDAANYRYVEYLQLAKDAGTTEQKTTLHRAGKANGTDIDNASLYTQAYLTETGWLYCDASVATVTHAGNPNKALSCGASVSIGGATSVDIAGKRMATLVTEQQQLSSGNVINAGMDSSALIQALGDAKFPDGSQLQQRLILNLNRPIYINNLGTDVFPQSLGSTLEQVIAARPASKANLATGSGMVNLGQGAGSNRNLRASFTGSSSASAGGVQYYSCEYNATQTAVSNCVAAETGTYAISTEKGSRVLRFAGHAATPMTHERLLVEVTAAQQRSAFLGAGDWVAVGRQDKPGLTVSSSQQNRLNNTAWTAMKAQLGL